MWNFSILLLFLICTTGIWGFESRIIDGIEANPGDNFVVMVRMLKSSNPPFEGDVSTGVVITNTFVLTVAQAVAQAVVDVTDVEVRSISDPDIRFMAEEVFLHPDYEDDTLLHNIALIRVIGDLTDNAVFRPVDFIEKGHVNQPIHADISAYLVFGIGWESMVEGSVADNVRYGLQFNVPFGTCLSTYNRLVVTESNFCGLTRDGSTPWHGDQGGPVTNFQRQLLGLISAFGIETQLPTIYVDIYAPREYAFYDCVINTNVNNNEISIRACIDDQINSIA